MSNKQSNLFIIYDDYAEMLVITKNKTLKVKIDIEDISKIKELGKWHAIKDETLHKTSYYICHRKIGQKCFKLHRFIMNCPQDKEIDHINHDTLDNRKSNLRICSRFENQQNLRSKATEQTGVYYRETRGYWVANISKDCKRYYKEFKTKEEAIQW